MTNLKSSLIILASVLILGACQNLPLCLAEDASKAFYNKDLNEDIGIWRMREKQLTPEEQKELDRHVENLNEARLKEQRAKDGLLSAETRLADFIKGRSETTEKGKANLQDEINRAERKAARTQEKLEKEKQEAELLKKDFDANLAKIQETLDKQQQKIEETIKKEQENLKATQENKQNISQKINEFQKAIEGKFTK